MMLRLLISVVAAVALLGSVQIAGATQALEVSGSTNLALIDDGDGVPETGDDCVLTGTLSSGSGAVAFSTTQNDVTNILICPGGVTMSGTSNCDFSSCGDDSSSNFGSMAINSSAFLAPSIPFFLEFVDETNTPGDGAPLGMTDPLDAIYGGEQSDVFDNPDGIGRFCTVGGQVAVHVNIIGGPSVLFSTSYFPDADTPTHLCIENIPFELTAGGHILRNLYLPVTGDRHLTAGSTSVDDVLIDIDLDTLLPCPIRAQAPAMNEWGLIAAVLVLLAVETWILSRRRSFYAGLPEA